MGELIVIEDISQIKETKHKEEKTEIDNGVRALTRDEERRKSSRVVGN